MTDAARSRAFPRQENRRAWFTPLIFRNARAKVAAQRKSKMSTAQSSQARNLRPPLSSRRQAQGVAVSELMTKPALSLREAAFVLDVSVDLLQKLILAGQGPKTFKIGRVSYIKRQSLVAWLDTLETNADSGTGVE